MYVRAGCGCVASCRSIWYRSIINNRLLCVGLLLCLICLSFSTAHTVLRCRQTVDLKAHHTVCVVCCYSSMHAMTLGQIVCGKMQIVCGKMNINARSTNLASSRGNCDQKQARFRRVGKVNRGEIERVAPSLNQETCTKKLEYFFFCVWKLVLVTWSKKIPKN